MKKKILGLMMAIVVGTGLVACGTESAAPAAAEVPATEEEAASDESETAEVSAEGLAEGSGEGVGSRRPCDGVRQRRHGNAAMERSDSNRSAA